MIIDKIVVASNNRHKIAELNTFISRYFPSVKLLSLADVNFFGEIVEDGATFEENALIKARAVSQLGYVAVADDSGLSVDALDGAPGVYSARYAGEKCDDAKNNEKLLLNMKSVPEGERGAKFVSVIACAFPDGKTLTARGECRGVILFEPRGDGGFGYDPLFMYEPMKKTYAEMNESEKNSISHRARAMAAFAEKLHRELI